MDHLLRRIVWAGLGPWGVGFGRRPFFVLASVVFGLPAVGLLASGCVGSVFVSPLSVRAGVDPGAC